MDPIYFISRWTITWLKKALLGWYCLNTMKKSAHSERSVFTSSLKTKFTYLRCFKVARIWFLSNLLARQRLSSENSVTVSQRLTVNRASKRLTAIWLTRWSNLCRKSVWWISSQSSSAQLTLKTKWLNSWLFWKQRITSSNLRDSKNAVSHVCQRLGQQVTLTTNWTWRWSQAQKRWQCCQLNQRA